MTLDELDKLAAEKVMGWEINEHPKNAYPAYWGRDSSARWLTDWQPTRNISQAFECLEKLNPYAFNLQRSSRGFSVGILLRFGEKFLFEPPMQSNNFHSTASEAIIRACLRAKGVEV